jgi:hypothetical protein
MRTLVIVIGLFNMQHFQRQLKFDNDYSQLNVKNSELIMMKKKITKQFQLKRKLCIDPALFSVFSLRKSEK